MRQSLFFLFCLGLVSVPARAAQAGPAAAPTESREQTPAGARPDASAPATSESAPGSTPPAASTETLPPAPTEKPTMPAADKSPAETPAEAVSSPPTAAVPASPAVAPPPSAPVPAAPDPRSEQLAVRLAAMEQLLLAQQEREAGMYRDTMRLVTTFGIAFAGVCVIGLLTAAFLNYRALVAVQNAYVRATSLEEPVTETGLLPAPTGPVPGMERIQASGQRFQSRMSSLEQRLAELEHLATHGAPVESGADAIAAPLAGPDAVVEFEEPAPPPPRRVVPRAMILVHKAQAQANLGKLDDALATLEEAAALEGANSDVHLGRGQVLEKLGRLGDALEAYEAAVQSDEANTNALLMKAGVLNRQERFNEALACYERALEVHRTHA